MKSSNNFVSNFFYHDRNFKQMWQSQTLDENFDKIEYGYFLKERYPYGYESVLIFVDHCDFDSPEKVEAVFYGTSDKNSKDYGKKGIVGTGLTATKTIFIDATGAENLGLENEKYSLVIDELFKDRVEIAAHSLRPKTSFDDNSPYLINDLKKMRKFRSCTWVDHGYLLHNMTRFGWDKRGKNYILDRLFENDYRYFWSRVDYSLNAPLGNLNLLSSWGRSGKDYLKKIFWLIKKNYPLNKIAFSFFWDFFGNLAGWEAKDDFFFSVNTLQRFFKKISGQGNIEVFEDTFGPIIRTFFRLINPLFYFDMIHNFFLPDKINSRTRGFYPVIFNDKQVFFFNSLWINDCVNCYSPKNIDKLIKEKGLHIGHNYFSVGAKHYLNSTVFKEGQHFLINPDFQRNLEYLSECQKQKKILITSVSTYGDFFSVWLRIKIKEISKNKISIKNTGEKRIEGFTISKKNIKRKPSVKIFPIKKYCSVIRGSEISLWLDLNPGEELSLEII